MFDDSCLPLEREHILRGKQRRFIAFACFLLFLNDFESQINSSFPKRLFFCRRDLIDAVGEH